MTHAVSHDPRLHATWLVLACKHHRRRKESGLGLVDISDFEAVALRHLKEDALLIEGEIRGLNQPGSTVQEQAPRSFQCLRTV